MDLLLHFFDMMLHLDHHLTELVTDYRPWVYGILFLIIFCETGLVVTPFLPGDSLLFVAGMLAGAGLLDPTWLMLLLILAAILGDSLNYSIGRWTGPAVFRKEEGRFFKRNTLNIPSASTKDTAAKPSSSPVSCLSCVPSRLSWRASATWFTGASWRITWPARFCGSPRW